MIRAKIIKLARLEKTRLVQERKPDESIHRKFSQQKRGKAIETTQQNTNSTKDRWRSTENELSARDESSTKQKSVHGLSSSAIQKEIDEFKAKLAIAERLAEELH